jgi:hypothetical protein
MFDLDVKITGFTRIDFDKKKIRKVLRKEGALVRKIARGLIMRRAISKPGEYPGRKKGATLRSIKAKVSKSGFLVRIAPQKTAEMGKDFYPAYLFYGSVPNNLAPRKNYMTEALDRRREGARAAILNGLKDSFKARK